MPLLAESLSRGIAPEAQPTERGEEGILYRTGPWWLKFWHTLPAKNFIAEPGGKVLPSPYWFLRFFYESSLIHAAFPEVTVQMSAGFDPRRDRHGGFSADLSGYPVTVTKNAETDDAHLLEIRTRMIRSAYEKIFSFHRETDHGRSASFAQKEAFYSLIEDVNQRMRALFGRELKLPRLDDQKTLNAILETAEFTDPDNVVLRLLGAGIIPVRPEFNFIPRTKNTDGSKPAGIFIELVMDDLKKYLDFIAGSAMSEQEKNFIYRAVNRYLLYLKLDQIYDFETKRRVERRVSESPETQRLLFSILEFLRIRPRERQNEVLSTLDDVLKRTKQIYEQARRESDVGSGLATLDNDLRAQFC